MRHERSLRRSRLCAREGRRGGRRSILDGGARRDDDVRSSGDGARSIGRRSSQSADRGRSTTRPLLMTMILRAHVFRTTREARAFPSHLSSPPAPHAPAPLGRRPLDVGLARHVLLLQRDVPAAAKFYTEGLGLVAHVCTDCWAELGDVERLILLGPAADAHRAPGGRRRGAPLDRVLPHPELHRHGPGRDREQPLRAGATLDGPIGPRARQSRRAPSARRLCSASTNPPRAAAAAAAARNPHRPARPRTRARSALDPSRPTPMTSSPRPASPPRGAGSRKRAPLDDAPPSSRSRARRASASAASPSSAEKEKGSLPLPPAGERRVILHADADAFFCQVERLRDPSLARAPALAIRQHGDVIAADAGARAAGVSKRDAPADASKLAEVGASSGTSRRRRAEGDVPPVPCRVRAHAEVIAADATKRAILDAVERSLPETGSRDEGSPPRQETNPTHRRVFGVVVEKASIDEAFVQLPAGSTLARDAEKAARALRDVVLERAGIRVSVGAASNKTLAKFASAAAKRRPLVGDRSSRSASRRDEGLVSRAPRDNDAREDGGPLGSSSPGVLAVKSDEDVRALLAVTPRRNSLRGGSASTRNSRRRSTAVASSGTGPSSVAIGPHTKKVARLPLRRRFRVFPRRRRASSPRLAGAPGARSALDAASGRCAAPVTPRGSRTNRSACTRRRARRGAHAGGGVRARRDVRRGGARLSGPPRRAKKRDWRDSRMRWRRTPGRPGRRVRRAPGRERRTNRGRREERRRVFSFGGNENGGVSDSNPASNGGGRGRDGDGGARPPARGRAGPGRGVGRRRGPARSRMRLSATRRRPSRRPSRRRRRRSCSRRRRGSTRTRS